MSKLQTKLATLREILDIRGPEISLCIALIVFALFLVITSLV